MCCGGAADRVGTRFARHGARHDEDARGRTETRARSGRSMSPSRLVRSLSGQESSTSLVYTRTVEDSRVEPGNSARHEEGQIRRVFERTRHFSVLSTLVYH